MKQVCICGLCVAWFWLPVFAQKKYRLAPPMIHYGSVFFENNTTVTLSFAQPGATIRYTTDGSEPNKNSPLYKAPITITQPTTLKAISTGKNFQSSATSSASFYHKGITIANISGTPPNTRYPGNGWQTLIDNNSGTQNFSDGNWLGFDADSVSLTIELAGKQKLHELMLHVYQNQSAWIFLPQRITVFADNKNGWTAIAEKAIAITQQDAAEIKGISIALPDIMVDKLQVVLYAVHPIPEWHQGKGKQGWLFMDEIKCY